MKHLLSFKLFESSDYEVKISDKKIEESIRYLNQNFEVSEDDFLNWCYDAKLDKEGFSKRERADIDNWTKRGIHIREFKFGPHLDSELIKGRY